MKDLPIWVLVPVAIAVWTIGFVVFWRVIVLIISRSARWPELMQKYATDDRFTGSLWRSASGHLGPVWYASSLTLGSSQRGLYLTPQFPFHYGTAPVLVPWSDIDVMREKRLFQQRVAFKFLNVPGLILRVSDRDGDWILNVARPAVRASESVTAQPRSE